MTTQSPKTAQWKVVPVEPTDAMIEAGCDEHECLQGDPYYSSPALDEGDCKAIYAAMLNATPPAPAEPQGEAVDFDHIAGMLESYVRCIKEYACRSDLERWHYIPEIEEQAEVLRTLSAPPPQQPAQGWQPIATAPKDGNSILLSNGTDVSQGQWVDEPPHIRERRDADGRYIDQDESDGFTGWIDWFGGMLPEPTHWMALPAAPGAVLEPAQSGRDAKDAARYRWWCDTGNDILAADTVGGKPTIDAAIDAAMTAAQDAVQGGGNAR